MTRAITADGPRSDLGMAFSKSPDGYWINVMADWVDLHPSGIHQVCCGGGGGALTNGYNEERIFYGRRKMEQIRAVGAQMLVLPCHSCHGQINNIKGHYGMDELTVKYLWELVADCLVLGP